MKKIIFILAIIFLSLTCGQQVGAAGSLADVGLSVNPQTAGSLATWVISFTVPQDMKLGHILISLGGFLPDLSSAELFVSGLPQGNPIVGKSNPSCVFNCDDIRYYYKDPITVKKNTKIIFTLNKVKNSNKQGPAGINFINLFSSKYPQMTLALAGGEQLINLGQALDETEDANTTPTADENSQAKSINQIQLNELFFQQGAKTTKLETIKDPARVSDLTLDYLGRERVSFQGALDLSKPEAVAFFQKLSDYLIFEKLSFEVKKEFMDYFQAPLEITFYDLPFVWDPDVKKDKDILAPDKLNNYHYVIFDNKPQVSLVIKEAAKYSLIPHAELKLADNQKFSVSDITVNGRISDPTATFVITLNGGEVKNLSIKPDSARGEFSFPLQLIEGANLIQVQPEVQYGEIIKINKVVQYLPAQTKQQKEKSLISPVNIAAIALAILAIIVIWAIRKLARKRR